MKEKIMLYFLLTSIIFLIGCNQEKVSCEGSGGEWATFGNNAADKCNMMIGGDVITAGCYCGTSKCWDGNKCINDDGEYEKNNLLE